MLASLDQLYLVVTSPDYEASCTRRFTIMTALLNLSTIADVCTTLSLLGQALETGQRLHHAFFLIRERALSNQALGTHIEKRLRNMRASYASSPPSLALLRSPMFMKHIATSVALRVS